MGGEDASYGDNDKLTIEGYAIDQDNNPFTADVLVVHEGPEKGRVELAGIGNIRFDELEPLSLKGTAEDLRIQLPAGSDPNVVLSDNGSTTDDTSRIDGDGFELTDFRNPTGSLTITDPSGVKQLFVRGLDPGFSADIELADAEFDNTVTFEQQELETHGGNLTAAGDKIRFFTNVKTLGGDIDLSADSEVVSTSSSQISTSATAGSGVAGGNLTVAMSSNGTASFLGSIITAGADSSTSNGGDGGNVSLTTENGTLSVAVIKSSGGQDLAGSRSGGNAGQILLATAGNGTLLNSDILAIGGSGQTPGSGGSITLDGPVTLESSIRISTGATAGNVWFRGSVDGRQAGLQNLTVEAGTGNVTLSASGQNVALGQITIQSATDVSLQSVRSSGLKQEAGTGTTTLAGPVTTTGAAGIDIKGKDLRIEKLVTAQSSGGMAINHTGTVTILGDGDIQSDGTVSISAAAISTAGNIQTTNDDITLTGVTTLTGSITLATGAAAGDIKLNSTIDGTTAGAQDLTLSAGTGNITLRAAAGQNVALGQLAIQSATDVSLQSVRTSGLKQEAGTGTTTLAGPVTTTGTAGVDIKGKDLRIEKLVTAQSSGGVAINHTGTVTILGDGDIQSDGTVSISAAAISTAGDIQTTNDDITLTGVTTLTGSITLATGTGAGDIKLNSTIDGTTAGAQDLTLNAGTGNITLGAPAGQNVALGQITIQSATDVSLQNVQASGLKQEAGTGFTTLAGAVTTTGAAGVNLTGKDLRIEKLVMTQSSGGVAINHTGTVTILGDGDIQSDGTVSISAAAISTAGDIQTTNDDITLTGVTTLTGSITLATGTGAGDIKLNSTIDGTTAGAQDLTLNAGTGNITLAASRTECRPWTDHHSIGHGCFTAKRPGFRSEAGSRHRHHHACCAVTTTGAAGVNLKGKDLRIEKLVMTQSSGGVAINHTGTVTILGDGDIQSDGCRQHLRSGNFHGR
ncbi:MAG UNVERIFIED_CONTAM: hypothetical protein LVR18_15850 [Planctomycetaceae bacterium]